MNLKALLTSLTLLGSTSVALAQPGTISVSASARASAQATVSIGSPVSTTVRDHRDARPAPPPPPAPAPVRASAPVSPVIQNGRLQRPEVPRKEVKPVLLSDPLTFDTTEYRKDIYPMTNQAFSRLVIQANGGETFVHEIRVQFTDHTWSVVELNETLRGTEQMVVPLGTTKPILRALIYRADGEAAHRLNERQRGSFLVSAL
jgi:hypothetical protein